VLPAKKRGSQLESNSSTESPDVRAGRLGRPHGLDGFLGLYVDPADLEYFDHGSTVFIQDRPFVVRAIRPADKGYQVAFDEVVDREGADRIRNLDVFVSERRTLGEQEFWPDQLVGLEVRPGGGTVVAIIHGPAQDRLVIEREGARFEIPFVDPLVPVVDLEAGYIETEEPHGLIDPV
jgi:16S rRNA processing protein RimM